MPHRILDYTSSIPSTHNGNKIISFSYSRQAGNIISDWSAELNGGSYVAGDAFSINIMQNAIITNVSTDPDGKVSLQGKDAGIRLMRPCPAPASLPDGDLNAIVSNLCSYCGISVSGGLPTLGFNARSVITGATCADAILELALLGGRIAYIANNGTLTLVTPAASTPSLPVPIGDGGTSLNTDGYATQVGVLLTRRAEDIEDEGGGETYYNGSTPSGSTSTQSDSGTFSAAIDEGTMSGSWSVEKIMPLDVISSSSCTITYKGITTVFAEEHDYEIETMTVWRGDQEYRLFAYLETGYTLTKTTNGSYQGSTGTKSFTEATAEVMVRHLSVFDDPAIFDEWKGRLDMVDKETVTRSTQRTGGPPPDPGDPPNSPEFDEKIERVYSRTNFGASLVCAETRIRSEKMMVALNKPVFTQTNDGQGNSAWDRLTMLVGGVAKNQLASGGAFLDWIKRRITRVTVDNYNDDGELAYSASSDWDDEGAADLYAKGYLVTGDTQQDEVTEEYLKFTQKSNGLTAGSSDGGTASTMWKFLELPGRQIVTTESGINAEDWYNNGTYVQSRLCPHYSYPNCRISDISTVPPMAGTKCPYRGLGWRSCLRAVAALEQARQEEDQPQLMPPVYGETGSTGIQYLHELTIEEIMTDAVAQATADAIAANILQVKSTRGIIRTVTIPFDSAIVPTGAIIGVSHELSDDSLSTTVSYLTNGTIPYFLLPGSYSTAVNVNGRETARRDRPRIGSVASISGKTVFVRVGNIVIRCTSKLAGIGVGDSVQVTMPAGSSSFGIITDRLSG